MATATRKRNRKGNGVATRKAKELATIESWSNPERYFVEIHDVPANAKPGWRPKKDAKPIERQNDDLRLDTAERFAKEYNDGATRKKSTLRAFVVKDEWLTWACELAKEAEKELESIRHQGEGSIGSVRAKYRDSWHAGFVRGRGFDFSMELGGMVNFLNLEDLEPDQILDAVLVEIAYKAQLLRTRLWNTREQRKASKGGEA